MPNPDAYTILGRQSLIVAASTPSRYSQILVVIESGNDHDHAVAADDVPLPKRVIRRSRRSNGYVPSFLGIFAGNVFSTFPSEATNETRQPVTIGLATEWSITMSFLSFAVDIAIPSVNVAFNSAS